MTQLRVGIVHYVNSRPLARGLLSADRGKDCLPELACERLSPATIATRLRDGTLDVGLVPSIEIARIPDLSILPGLAIAATHEVRSVLLVSRVPISEIRSVALDENSRTSAALLAILLAERYGRTPVSTPARPELSEMLAHADAALVIGDPALAVDRDRYVVLDLAGEWLELTGLPFVFAVWAARDAIADRVPVELFAASLELGLAELDAIVEETAAETGIARPVLRDYFTRNLSYRMGPAERAGLAEFLARAARHGLAPATPELRFLPATFATR